MRFVKTAENLFGLPQGFTRVEYLQSSGTQYIDTGVDAKTGLTIESKFKFLKGGGIYCGAITTTSGSGDRYYAINLANNPNVCFTYMDTQFTGATALSIGNVYTVKTVLGSTRQEIFVDGVSKGYTTKTVTADLNWTLGLFAVHRGGTFNPQWYDPVTTSMYYCKIWDNGVLVRDFIPCIDPLGVACMYDLVGKKAYYNQGTGEFTVGRKIIPVEYLESTGVEYIDTGYKPVPATTKFEFMFQCDDVTDNTFMFGSRPDTSAASQYTCTTYKATSRIRQDWAGLQEFFTGITTTDKYIYTAYNNTITLNDTTVTGTIIRSTNRLDYNLLLFTVNTAGTADSRRYVGKVYYSKLWDDGVLVRDFIPCKDENNIGFMFDNVSGTVYENAGTGAFIVGNNKYNMKLRLIKDNILPTGYTHVEYLESSGTQYIDTGFKPNQNTSFNITVSMQDNTEDTAILGCKGTGNNRFSLGYNFSPRFVDKFFMALDSGLNNIGVDFTIGVDEKAVISFKKVSNSFKLEVNGLSVERESETINPNTNLIMFAREWNGSVGSYSKCKIYECKIYDNGTIVRDFVPAIDPSGTPCMYDLVTRTPFYNAGTGTFTTGKPVLPMVRFVKDIIPREYAAVNYIESTGTQYIDTGVLANGSFDAEYKIKTTSTNTRNFIVAGARTATQHLNFGQFEPASRNFILAYLGSWWTINNKIYLDTEYETKIHYESGNQYAILNDETIGNASLTGTEQLDINIYLFKRNFYNPEVQEGIRPMIGRMYYFKIWNNNVLVRNFIPVVRRVDKVAGMWDTVTKQFFTTPVGAFNYG